MGVHPCVFAMMSVRQKPWSLTNTSIQKKAACANACERTEAHYKFPRWVCECPRLPSRLSARRKAVLTRGPHTLKPTILLNCLTHTRTAWLTAETCQRSHESMGHMCLEDRYSRKPARRGPQNDPIETPKKYVRTHTHSQ